MYYQLLIELEGIEPKIWRKVLVSPNVSMRYLHHTIQVVMGWENQHLYKFVAGNEQVTQIEFLETDDFLEDHEIHLDRFFSKEGDQMTYVYDFGDDWKHTITLEKIVSEEDGKQVPFCLGGERNCPPEDIGGIPGYHEFCAIMGNPKLPEYDEKYEWWGGEYEPDYCPVDIINEDLEGIDAYVEDLGDDWLTS
jgi:hypothetical protein